MDKKHNHDYHKSNGNVSTDDIEFKNIQHINWEEEEDIQASSLSSSPPNDFDVNLCESQYIPIYDEDCSQSLNNDQQSSLASSLSLDSNHDFATSPVLLTNACGLIRCPVCEKPMRTFYCAKCIQKGLFVTKDSPVIDVSKENVLRIVEEPTTEIFQDQNDTKHKGSEENSSSRLSNLTRKTEALKNLYSQQKLKLDETKTLLQETKRQLEIEKKSNKSMESKIELIKRFIISRQASVKKRRDSENQLVDDLKQYISRRVYQLTNDVFPIEEINLMDQNNSFANMETSPLLTFSDDSHHQIEHQTAYSIVEPWLPSNGDYSAYSLWVNDNQDHIPASMSNLSERNPAYRIGAALAYTSQLVKNLASYLDIILPAKVDLSTFNREPQNDPQFSYNVAKLNANVIHLCISQGVDISLLNPQKTLKNLSLLLNINLCDLGRKPTMELDNLEAIARVEEQLATDLSLVQDDFYDFSKFADDDDLSDSEWEISETIHPLEMQLANEQSIQQNSYISRLPLRLFASFWTSN